MGQRLDWKNHSILNRGLTFVPLILAPNHRLLQRRKVHVHLVLMVHKLLAQRRQLVGRETGHLRLLPQLVQLLVLEQAAVLVRVALVAVRLLLVLVIDDTTGVLLLVLVLLRILGIVEMLENVVRRHDGDQFLAQGRLLEAVLVLVLAVELLPGQLFFVVDLQVGEERLELRLGEALCAKIEEKDT